MHGERARTTFALIAVFDLDPRLAALLLAAFGLHAAAYGSGPLLLRPRSAFVDADEDWDPFR